MIFLNYSLLYGTLQKERIPGSMLCCIDCTTLIWFICSNSHAEEGKEIINKLENRHTHKALELTIPLTFKALRLLFSTPLLLIFL